MSLNYDAPKVKFEDKRFNSEVRNFNGEVPKAANDSASLNREIQRIADDFRSFNVKALSFSREVKLLTQKSGWFTGRSNFTKWRRGGLLATQIEMRAGFRHKSPADATLIQPVQLRKR